MPSDGEDQIRKQVQGAANDWLEDAAAQQAFGRLLNPAEVARAVAYLACDESGLKTGTMMNFDQTFWGAMIAVRNRIRRCNRWITLGSAKYR